MWILYDSQHGLQKGNIVLVCLLAFSLSVFCKLNKQLRKKAKLEKEGGAFLDTNTWLSISQGISVKPPRDENCPRRINKRCSL
jgi:hypothetical protein